MKKPMKLVARLVRARAVVLAALLLMPIVQAVAQDYPNRPIRFVVPFTPGGSQDVIARIFAQKLSESLHQQVVVDNRGGAAGLIAAEMVAKAPRDGYTMLLASGGQISLAPALHSKLAYDPVRDFRSVGQIAEQAMSLIVNNSVPAKSVAELVTYGKGLALYRTLGRIAKVPTPVMEACIALAEAAVGRPLAGDNDVAAALDLDTMDCAVLLAAVQDATSDGANGRG